MGAMTKSLHSREHKALIEQLVQLRQEAQMTQRQVAKRLKVSHSWMAKVEGGERRLDVVEFFWLCNAMGVDPAKAAADAMNRMQRKRP